MQKRFTKAVSFQRVILADEDLSLRYVVAYFTGRSGAGLALQYSSLTLYIGIYRFPLVKNTPP
ncbi:MAG: hypothetical protein RBR06_06625 [Desulfuromonadaceae bacterium]|nr:hypothetical protein [Desulfuromonadaceae bacterium]